jgi:uncharacterized protein YbjT (DUF2867 family)
MKNKTATLIGATGLIGGHLLELLQNDSTYTKIKVLVRRPMKFDNPKINVSIIDFTDKVSLKSEISGSEVVFCSIGTTSQKMKGDKEEYRKIDYDIPVNAAQFSLETGCLQFVYVSSLGANSNSNNFYLKLKGEVEDKLRSLNMTSLSIFRPSLLLGKRQEFRLGEIVGKLLMKPISFLFPTNMKPIKASEVAKSMLEASKLSKSGIHIYHYKEIMQFINTK